MCRPPRVAKSYIQTRFNLPEVQKLHWLQYRKGQFRKHCEKMPKACVEFLQPTKVKEHLPFLPMTASQISSLFLASMENTEHKGTRYIEKETLK